MKLSVVIPAHNEEACIARTVRILYGHLNAEKIDHEILVVNDNSSDSTEEILKQLQEEIPTLRYVNNCPPHGFGFAVRAGLEHYTGDAIAVYMADNSDRPEDLVQYLETMEEQQVDCVFGSRFVRGAKVVDYPFLKLTVNRIANRFIQVIFGLRYNDVTNAFKLYRRHVVDGLKPFLSHHFNLTVELPLKAIVRGYSYAVVPNDWINRKTGESKLKVQEMGSRYLFIVLYCLIEKWLSHGDYLKHGPAIITSSQESESTSEIEPVVLDVSPQVQPMLEKIAMPAQGVKHHAVAQAAFSSVVTSTGFETVEHLPTVLEQTPLELLTRKADANGRGVAEATAREQVSVKAFAGKWLILGVFVACLIWAIFMASVGWHNTLTDAHGFRQTQTAITSYYMAQGGAFLNYETPIVGAPWSIPFEFPLYQWVVADSAKLFHTQLDSTGRAVSEIFFVLSLAVLWFLLAEFRIKRDYRLIFLTLVLVSPQYLFWSRTFMIESTALFFCLGYLLFLVRYLRTRKLLDALAGGLFASLGVLVKVTTFPSFGLIAALLYLWSLRREFPNLKSSKVIRQQALPILMFAVLPLLVAWGWVHYTDQVKSLNIVGANLTSSALQPWNFGTLSQRFMSSTWLILLFRTIPDLLGSTVILLLPLLGLFFARHRLVPFLICLCGFLAAFLIFTNLHVVHTYYAYANGIFLIGAISWSIVGLLEGQRWRRYIGLAVFLVCVSSSVAGYYGQLYKTQKQNSTSVTNIATAINTTTQPEDVVLIFGPDYSAEIPYYSQRRALMWPKWMNQDFDDPQMKEAINRLGNNRIGALVVCKQARANSQMIQRATSSLGLVTKAAYEGSGCALYPTPTMSGNIQAAGLVSDAPSITPTDITVITPSAAQMTASPNPVPAGPEFGTTKITWDMGDSSWGQVYVSVEGDAETLFAQGAKGSSDAPWIGNGRYEFRLYAGQEHKKLLAVVKVTRSQ